MLLIKTQYLLLLIIVILLHSGTLVIDSIITINILCLYQWKSWLADSRVKW